MSAAPPRTRGCSAAEELGLRRPALIARAPAPCASDGLGAREVGSPWLATGCLDARGASVVMEVRCAAAARQKEHVPGATRQPLHGVDADHRALRVPLRSAPIPAGHRRAAQQRVHSRCAGLLHDSHAPDTLFRALAGRLTLVAPRARGRQDGHPEEHGPSAQHANHLKRHRALRRPHPDSNVRGRRASGIWLDRAPARARRGIGCGRASFSPALGRRRRACRHRSRQPRAPGRPSGRGRC